MTAETKKPEVRVIDVRKSAPAAATLPPTQTIIHMEWTDDAGLTLAGYFTVERLNIGKLRAVALREAQLNGGMKAEALGNGPAQLNAMLAHFEQALIDHPKWWKPDEFYDTDPIYALFEEVMRFEGTFRRAPVRAVASSPEADGPKQSEQRRVPAGTVVVEEVSAPADA